MQSRHPSSSLLLVSAGLLALAGCSKGSDTTEAADAAEESANVAPPAAREGTTGSSEAQAPDIGQNVAPGVAFTYRYAFTLPAKAISGIQQQHAAACERLGPTRCKITGMSYDQPQKDDVSARLDLLLAPEVAHSFSGDAIAAVEKANGSIDNASVEGDNAGGAIEDSQRRSSALRAQLDRIEQRLKIPGLGKEEKIELARRASELREQLGSEQQVREDKEVSIATTPVSFAYSSEGVFSASNDPFGKAAASSFGSLKATLAFLLTAAGLLLPWLLLGALVVLLLRFRAMKQRLARATDSAAASAPPQ